MYTISFYWSLTTIVTVGYGDITAGNTVERIYSLLIMSVGVVTFSFAIGSITNIVEKIDSKSAEVNQKMEMLRGIRTEFNLPDEVYEKAKKVTKYHYNK
jgi:hypothetical protein